MSAYVYRASDASGRLLYVGCSVDVEARLRYHEANAQWWPFHESVAVEEFATQKEALAAEAVAIATEHPRWNMAGRSDDHPDGKCNTVQQAHWLDYERDVSRRHRSLIAEEQRLLRALRKVRMGLAGTRLEVACLRDGFAIDLDEEPAA